MRNSTRVLSLACLTMLAMSTASTADDSGAEKAVVAAEHQWLKAEQTNNVELVRPLLADSVVLTTEDGRVLRGKDAVISDAKTTSWRAAATSDLRVTVFGQAAIATGTFIGKGTGADGKQFDTRVRFTDTWVRGKDGTWQCVAGHDSPTKG
jgi:uncharacterized protein (TIGR02246 family)